MTTPMSIIVPHCYPSDIIRNIRHKVAITHPIELFSFPLNKALLARDDEEIIRLLDIEKIETNEILIFYSNGDAKYLTDGKLINAVRDEESNNG